jgi:signal peptidase
MSLRRSPIFLAIVVVIATAPVLLTAAPWIVGADASFIVVSDSMSPTIDRGSVVVVDAAAAEELERGDVITFHSSGTRVTTTHRIIDVRSVDGERRFKTKGDAVKRADSELVRPDQIVGKVVCTIPLLGNLLSWLGISVATVLFVVLPYFAVGVWGALQVVGSACRT